MPSKSPIKIKKSSKTKMPTFNRNIWISATELRNYMIRDPLLDWLKVHYKIGKLKKYKKVISKVIKKVNTNTFHGYLLNQGNEFEEKVVEKLIEIVGANKFIRLYGEKDATSKVQFEKTIDAMKKGIPVIHSGLLHNDDNNTFGIPDLIVRSDYFSKIFNTSPLESKETKISAPNLISSRTKKPFNYHYRIIDIKFSTLPLRANGINLLNSNHIPAYKAQLWIYNQALSKIQGYNPMKSYILGRRWKYESCEGEFEGKSCFDRLGVIDYAGVDKCYSVKSQEAIKWVRDVKSPAAKKWQIDKLPLSRPELYPNMSNKHDEPWGEVKKQISENINELTSVWMVSTKHRDIARENGIYSWTDKKCDASSMGINGEKIGPIINAILKTNRGKTKFKPSKISNNVHGWSIKGKVEFYVDFETLGTMFTEFDNVENSNEKTLIFMIGVGYIEPETKQWIYQDFTCANISKSEEVKICTEFTNYITDVARRYKCKHPKCIHWAPAEPIEWERFYDRYYLKDIDAIVQKTQSVYGWEWVDLLDVFKSEPITIKGCFNFSLKSVSNSMKTHKMIKTIWDNDCVDGRDAMMLAWNAYKKNKPLESSEMKSIIKYNEVDVKVLYEIITYLRTKL